MKLDPIDINEEIVDYLVNHIQVNHRFVRCGLVGCCLGISLDLDPVM
jgi:hypothetical protein